MALISLEPHPDRRCDQTCLGVVLCSDTPQAESSGRIRRFFGETPAAAQPHAGATTLRMSDAAVENKTAGWCPAVEVRYSALIVKGAR